jgi:polyhydroxybutyrate depolymerase
MDARRALVPLVVLAAACSQTPSPNAAPSRDASGKDGSTTQPSGSNQNDGATSDVAAGEGSPAKTETLTMTTGGQARIVSVHSPPNLRGPVPLVFNLHGSGGTAADQEAFTTMDQAADALGFVAAYPQGGIALGAGFAWNVPGQPLAGGVAVPPEAGDDAAYFAQAISAIEQGYPIDAKRVYAAGFSGGGRMASQLACDLSSTVAAVAPVAGLRFPSPCNSQRLVPVVAFHGTADTTNPYDGGGPTYWTYSVPSAAQQWSLHNGCGSAPVISQPAPGVQLTAYPDCSAGAAIALYTIEGAGHEWPGAPGQTNALSATAVMWAFFLSHPLP